MRHRRHSTHAQNQDPYWLVRSFRSLSELTWPQATTISPNFGRPTTGISGGPRSGVLPKFFKPYEPMWPPTGVLSFPRLSPKFSKSWGIGGLYGCGLWPRARLDYRSLRRSSRAASSESMASSSATMSSTSVTACSDVSIGVLSSTVVSRPSMSSSSLMGVRLSGVSL